MPVLFERSRPTKEQLRAVFAHIRRRREREKAEEQAKKAKEEEEKKKKEEEAKKRKEELEDVANQIAELEAKLVSLREEKHQLFAQLKKVLLQKQEDENRKRPQFAPAPYNPAEPHVMGPKGFGVPPGAGGPNPATLPGTTGVSEDHHAAPGSTKHPISPASHNMAAHGAVGLSHPLGQLQHQPGRYQGFSAAQYPPYQQGQATSGHSLTDVHHEASHHQVPLVGAATSVTAPQTGSYYPGQKAPVQGNTVQEPFGRPSVLQPGGQQGSSHVARQGGTHDPEETHMHSKQGCQTIGNHSSQGPNQGAHSSQGQGAHSYQGLNQGAHSSQGPNQGAHSYHGPNHSHSSQGPNQITHLSQGSNQGAHAYQGHSQGPHSNQGPNQGTLSSQVTNQSSHSNQGPNQSNHSSTLEQPHPPYGRQPSKTSGQPQTPEQQQFGYQGSSQPQQGFIDQQGYGLQPIQSQHSYPQSYQGTQQPQQRQGPQQHGPHQQGSQLQGPHQPGPHQQGQQLQGPHHGPHQQGPHQQGQQLQGQQHSHGSHLQHQSKHQQTHGQEHQSYHQSMHEKQSAQTFQNLQHMQQPDYSSVHSQSQSFSLEQQRQVPQTQNYQSQHGYQVQQDQIPHQQTYQQIQQSYPQASQQRPQQQATPLQGRQNQYDQKLHQQSKPPHASQPGNKQDAGHSGQTQGQPASYSSQYMVQQDYGDQHHAQGAHNTRRPSHRYTPYQGYQGSKGHYQGTPKKYSGKYSQGLSQDETASGSSYSGSSSHSQQRHYHQSRDNRGHKSEGTSSYNTSSQQRSSRMRSR